MSRMSPKRPKLPLKRSLSAKSSRTPDGPTSRWWRQIPVMNNLVRAGGFRCRRNGVRVQTNRKQCSSTGPTWRHVRRRGRSADAASRDASRDPTVTQSLPVPARQVRRAKSRSVSPTLYNYMPEYRGMWRTAQSQYRCGALRRRSRQTWLDPLDRCPVLPDSE